MYQLWLTAVVEKASHLYAHSTDTEAKTEGNQRTQKYVVREKGQLERGRAASMRVDFVPAPKKCVRDTWRKRHNKTTYL